jgi:signal transduction histidine kinase
MIVTRFGDLIADRMREAHRALAARWFERLFDLLPVQAREVFPTDSLLDHIPALILEISDYLREPDHAIAANTAILDKARELGALRHSQRASLHQVLREYQILGAVLVTFVQEEIDRLDAAPGASECVSLVARLQQAVNVLSQATVEAFVASYTQTIGEQNERLEAFTRMATHEWRQPLSALQFGVGLLRRSELDRDRADRTLTAMERTVDHLVQLTRKLETIARMHTAGDNPVVQQVAVGTIALEAARQLREMAEARGVEIRVADELPVVTVDVGRLELVLVNLLSNAVKYADCAKPVRFVEVTGTPLKDGWCGLAVRDNGVGIPEQALSSIFQRFTRAHTTHDHLADVSGIGLGLAIVEDCVRAMAGEITVRSREAEGTSFELRLPATPSS